MKFKNKRELLKNKDNINQDLVINDLLSYIEDLEDNILSSKSIIDSEKIKLDKMIVFLDELENSIDETFKEDEIAKRFKETKRVDYENKLNNLKNYISKFRSDNKL